MSALFYILIKKTRKKNLNNCSRIVSIIFCLFSGWAYSQKKEFQITYQITYVKDSTEQHIKLKEYAYLFVREDKSIFVSENRFKADSILSTLKKGNASIVSALSKPRYTSHFNFVIQKSKDFILYKERIAGLGNFIYREEVDFSTRYKITDETTTLLGYPCKKALLNYGGRNWVIWYSDEISIPDGPYKFGDLPGLILAANDTKNQYSFEAVAIEQKEFPQKMFSGDEGTSISTTRASFNKTKQNYYNNPIQASNGRMNYRDKDQERSFVQRMKKNNNFIELK